MIKVEVIGLKSLDRQLKKLPDAVLRKVVRPATSKSMTPVLQDARKRAEVIKDTGLLAKSLGRKSKTYINRGVIIHIIGPRTGFKKEVTRTTELPDGRILIRKMTADPAHYAHLVEFGTQAHMLGQGESVRKGTRNVFDAGGMHPGTKAQPFMRPAFDNNESRILSIYRMELKKGVIREAHKLRGRK